MFVRSSKFRHVFGSPSRKEHCYEGMRITKSAHDSNFCAVNPKFLAVVLESSGGGAFLVLPLEKTGRIDFNVPKVCGHCGPVTDVKWNPFNDHLIASASDDTTIKLWEIPDCGLREDLSKWVTDLRGHFKRVTYIEWHPTAADILLSTSADFQCILWNVSSSSAVREISVHCDFIFSISWSRDGSLFATTSKDKFIRVIDPRNGNVIAKGQGHRGSKASKVVFLGANNRLFTTGFSRTSERQYAIWDTNQMSEPLKIEEIDSSSGLLMPFYDRDTNIVYLAGKGDGNIRYMEIVDSPPYAHYLSQYQSSSPQRSLGVMPKRGVDVSRCEIFRFYKLHSLKELCEPLSMIVPRRSEVFQSDLYPPAPGPHPALTADEWLRGENREPVLVSLKDGVLQTSAISLRQSSNDKSFISPLLGDKILPSSLNRIEDNRGPNSRVVCNSNTSVEPVISRHSSHVQLELERKNLNKNSDADDKNTQSLEMADNSIVSPRRAVVHRAATFHGSSSTGTPRDVQYTLSPDDTFAPSSDRLGRPRNASLMSDGGDISDLPVTPVTHPHKVVRRHRRRQKNDDGSSSSSTEDLDTLGTAWTKNPLYSRGKSPLGRCKNGRIPHRRAPPFRSNVDLGPLNEVLNGSEFRSPNRPLSKSSCDLVSKIGGKLDSKSGFDFASKSSGDLMTQSASNSTAKSYRDLVSKSIAGTMPNSTGNFSSRSNFVPIKSGLDQVSKSSGNLMIFKESDPDGKTLRRFPESHAAIGSKTGTGILHPKVLFRSEPDVAVDRRNRLDAEQNRTFETRTVRQMAPLARAEDDAILDDELLPDGSRAMIHCISMEAPDDTLIKPSLLRASTNSRQRRPCTNASESSSTISSTTSGMPLRRTGSLRETKSSFPSSSVVGNPLATRTKSTTFLPIAETSAFQPFHRQSKNDTDVVMSGHKVIPPVTSMPPPRFLMPNSDKSYVLPNPFVFTVPAESVKKVVKISNNCTSETHVNGVMTDGNDPDRQRLLDLCKRQRDEIRFLRQQLSDRDAKIRLLESQLHDQAPSSDQMHRNAGMTNSNV